VSDKYKTKNIKTEGKDVFLTTINHMRANIISSKNFRLTATRTYKVWLSGSLFRPLKKIRRVINEIAENTVASIAISLKGSSGFTSDINKNPANNIRK
jgi:hypothetical protein